MFADRARYYADPDFALTPIAQLLAPAYTAARAALIDPARARADQTPGDVQVPASDTTYLTVVDDTGQMVSLIQSLFVPFGSALVVPEFGFALQSRGSGFALETGHPAEEGPGAPALGGRLTVWPTCSLYACCGPTTTEMRTGAESMSRPRTA